MNRCLLQSVYLFAHPPASCFVVLHLAVPAGVLRISPRQIDMSIKSVIDDLCLCLVLVVVSRISSALDLGLYQTRDSCTALGPPILDSYRTGGHNATFSKFIKKE